MGQRQLTTPQLRLKAAVEARGWRLSEVIDENLAWWEYQRWVLESTWSPTGTRLLVTFVIDRMYETGPKRRWLYEAVVSWEAIPSYLCEGAMGHMSMQHGWERDLTLFIDTLDRVRTERTRDASQAPPN